MNGGMRLFLKVDYPFVFEGKSGGADAFSLMNSAAACLPSGHFRVFSSGAFRSRAIIIYHFTISVKAPTGLCISHKIGSLFVSPPFNRATICLRCDHLRVFPSCAFRSRRHPPRPALGINRAPLLRLGST